MKEMADSRSWSEYVQDKQGTSYRGKKESNAQKFF